MPRFWKGQPLDPETLKPTGKILLTAPSLPKIKEEISGWAKKASADGVVHVCRVDTKKASIAVICALAARKFKGFEQEQEATFSVTADGTVSTFKGGKAKAAKDSEDAAPAKKAEKSAKAAAPSESPFAKKKGLQAPDDVKPKKSKK